MNPLVLAALAVVAFVQVAECILLVSSAGALTLGTLTVSGVTGAGLLAGGAAVGALLLGKAALLAAANNRKRETADCLPFKNAELYFQLAANGDFLSCGRRFVCELEATPKDKLANEEQLLLGLFGSSASAQNGTARGAFVEAGAIGINEGVVGCARAFESCPFDRKTIFLAFQAAQKSQ
ncbi:unnamed protein product [Meganyctiphanes norvegica]|uniref:Uncharacterized protein n=1 Tax=Meganyctiphanes norvegica TaxID=48144 RepID=A0AAV2PPX3_MEGNR